MALSHQPNVVVVAVFLAAPFCMGHHSEQTHKKDLAMVLRQVSILTQPGLEPAPSGLQHRSTDHQATTAPSPARLTHNLKCPSVTVIYNTMIATIIKTKT